MHLLFSWQRLVLFKTILSSSNENAIFSLQIKPSLNDIRTEITEYDFPAEETAPLFPVYDGENIDELRLVAYSDSDHRSRSSFTRTIPEDDTKRNRSTSGYVIMAGSIAISYNAKLEIEYA